MIASNTIGIITSGLKRVVLDSDISFGIFYKLPVFNSGVVNFLKQFLRPTTSPSDNMIAPVRVEFF